MDRAQLLAFVLINYGVYFVHYATVHSVGTTMEAAAGRASGGDSSVYRAFATQCWPRTEVRRG